MFNTIDHFYFEFIHKIFITYLRTKWILECKVIISHQELGGELAAPRDLSTASWGPGPPAPPAQERAPPAPSPPPSFPPTSPLVGPAAV